MVPIGNGAPTPSEFTSKPPAPRRLLALAGPQAGPLALALVLLAAYSALGLVIPWAIGGLLDRVLAGGQASPALGGPAAGIARLPMIDGLAGFLGQGGQAGLDRLTVALAVVFGLRALLLAAHSWLLAHVGGRIIVDLRARLFRRLTELGPDFHDRHPSADLVSRLLSDTAGLQAAVTSDLATLVSSALIFMGGLLILVAKSPLLSLILLAVLPPVVLLAWGYGRRMRRSGELVQARTAEASALAQESLGAVHLVQIFVREEHEQRRFGLASLRLFDSVMQRVRLNALFGSGVAFLSFGALTVVLWAGGREVLAGRLSAGELIGYLIYGQMVGFAAMGLISLWGRWANALGAATRVFEILDEEGEPAERAAPPVTLGIVAAGQCDASPPAGRTSGSGARIDFQGVRFGYRPGQEVLRGIDLSIAAGESLALVGRSGAGKSTLCQLIARFYDPWEGAVRVDGVDLRSLDRREHRRRIGAVPQDTLLFNLSVAENLRFGRPAAGQAELEAAARQANAHDFIAALPDGYQTVLGERGGRLSMGQRQRIAIARALLADPAILLLDEATSSLDSESEQAVREALARLRAGRTTIAIAHRLSTVREADRIAVLDEGRIVELGRHEELLAAGGLYRRFCDQQFLSQD